MSIEEILSHAKTLVQLSTHTRRAKATLDPVPLVGSSHSPLKPTGEVVKPILQVGSVRLEVTGTPNGHHVHKNHQTRQQHYEDQHGHEVGHEQPWDSPKGADEPGESHDQDQDAEDYDRPLQDLDAGVVRL